MNNNWDNCKTELEKQLYLVKNMEKLNKNSKPYISGEYEELFNLSEIATMKEEEYTAYRNSTMYEMEWQSTLEYARNEGYEEGMAIASREKGRMAAKMEIAKKMKDKGMSFADISMFTGLSDQQIAAL